MSLVSNQTKNQFDKLYKRPSLHYYIHCHMKNPQVPEGFYRSDKFKKALDWITGYYKGKNPFLFKRAGLTPTHVALTSGNETGLKILAERGCIQNILATRRGIQDVPEDIYNCLPIEYAKKHQPHLLKYFLSFEGRSDEKMRKKVDGALSSQRGACINEIARCSTASAPKFPSSFTYSICQDFGVEIQKLLFSCPSQKEGEANIEWTVKNMQALSAKLGFELLLSKKPYWVRDSWLCTRKRERLLSSQSEHVLTALKRAHSLHFFQGKNPAYLTTHQFFKNLIGLSLQQGPHAALHYEELTGEKNIKMPLFYMEGGNHFCVSNLNNKHVLLIGEDQMAVIQNQLRLQRTFDDPLINIAESVKQFSKRLTTDPNLLKTTVLEMYAQGLMRIGGKDGIISKENIKKLMTEFDISIVDHKTGLKKAGTPIAAQDKEKTGHVYLKRAIEQGLFVYPALPKDLSKSIPNAAKYLAQKELTKDILTQTFSVDQTFVIPQLFYHLDLFLRPGPKGSFFGLDFALTIKCLQEIAYRQSALGLNEQDQELLKNYIETTKALNQEVGGLWLEVLKKIHEAKFFYLPVPGFFLSQSVARRYLMSSSSTQHVNFLNAITGWSPKTKRYYYITSGTSAGSRLGKILQEVFEASLKRYCPEMDVYYVGYNPSAPEDFSEADQLINQYGTQAGVHCLSFEWETRPHTA